MITIVAALLAQAVGPSYVHATTPDPVILTFADLEPHLSEEQALELQDVIVTPTAVAVDQALALIPATTSADTVLQFVVATADSTFYVAEFAGTGGEHDIRFFEISPLGIATELANGSTTVTEDGMVLAEASSTATGGYAEMGTPLGPCDAQCTAAGIAGSVIYGALVCTLTLPLLGTVACWIASAVFGAGADYICKDYTCKKTKATMGVTDFACSFAYCDFTIHVKNEGRQLTSIASQINWWYPYGFWARNSAGQLTNHHTDQRSHSTTPWGDTSVGQIYKFRHISTDSSFVNCATEVDFAINVAWSDSSFMSSGWRTTGKPARTDCPGYDTYLA